MRIVAGCCIGVCALRSDEACRVDAEGVPPGATVAIFESWPSLAPGAYVRVYGAAHGPASSALTHRDPALLLGAYLDDEEEVRVYRETLRHYGVLVRTTRSASTIAENVRLTVDLVRMP